MALYETDESSVWGAGIPITTQSMMRAFLQCPREAYYKYILRLQPKILSEPLTRGKWIHSLLEVYYRHLQENSGEKEVALEAMRYEHRKWSGKFSKLFDEEKEKLGNLPVTILQIMEGYFWHYGNPQYQDLSDWVIREVEIPLEAKLPNGHIFRGRFDLLVENSLGLWLVDHKSHKRLPDWSHRMFDVQAPLYTWAARENGIPVRGFIWNYISTSPRPIPFMIKDGSRFSKTGWNTEYPIALQAIKDAGWIKGNRVEVPGNPSHTEELRKYLRLLRYQRWAPEAIPSSPFYRRDEIMHDSSQVDRVVNSACQTSERMHSYDFTDEDLVERNPVECKGWRCSYQSLSMADLVLGNSDRLRNSDYMEGDPLGYYNDDEEVFN